MRAFLKIILALLFVAASQASRIDRQVREVHSAQVRSAAHGVVIPVPNVKRHKIAVPVKFVGTPVVKTGFSKDSVILPEIPDDIVQGDDQEQLRINKQRTVQTLLSPKEQEQLPIARQAAQSTSSHGTTTPANLVQQLIQNSPLVQFISQFTGSPGSLQSQVTAEATADEPQPTIPGFLNPSAAITSAQLAVQNAAQSVVNSTTQAFQGFQQFASNLGNQFQNTLSNLGNPQSQLATVDTTTERPQGPLQSFVSNFVSGGTYQSTELAPVAPSTAQQGPLQGLLSLFQGGNRPQNSIASTPSVESSSESNKEKPDQLTLPKDPIKDADKIDAHPEEMLPVVQNADVSNEIRTSEEIIDSSFEEAHPDELIIVNDDAIIQ